MSDAPQGTLIFDMGMHDCRNHTDLQNSPKNLNHIAFIMQTYFHLNTSQCPFKFSDFGLSKMKFLALNAATLTCKLCRRRRNDSHRRLNKDFHGTTHVIPSGYHQL